MSDVPFWLSGISGVTHGGKARGDDRRVISGIIPVLKSGCRWVDAPSIYGLTDAFCRRARARRHRASRSR